MTHRTAPWIALTSGAAALLALLSAPRDAAACGCFTPPDPSVPVVQAGERIVFARVGDEVLAHIQIQYQGDAKEFGWILPLPSVPMLELGADELFTQITSATQPKYRLTRVYSGFCNAPQSRGGFASAGGGEFAPSADAEGNGKSSPLVVQDSIGPYDYAVLKADDKKDMLDWLAANRYFVPAGTDAAAGPYIRPGAFFLALKLRSGRSAGDLQPVVLRYKSDLPMIPIVLTSVAANPDMGIQVWMVGEGRAIPRNYYHTVLNDAALDWVNAGANYNDLVIRATKEAPGRHTFITEYAGTSDVMKNLLDGPGRFGAQADLARQLEATGFIGYLRDHGFLFGGALNAILEREFPLPAALEKMGISKQQYYGQIEFWLGDFRRQNPQSFAGLEFNFDAPAMADEIFMRVVKPSLDAGMLFTKHPYLTRLYTTLSPEQMDRDPVFSYNPELPKVDNVHEGTLTYACDIFGNITGGTLKTAQGHEIDYPAGNPPATLPAMPASDRIEMLRESGAPEPLVDNGDLIRGALSVGGCSVAPGAAASSPWAAVALGLFLAAALRRRRR